MWLTRLSAFSTLSRLPGAGPVPGPLLWQAAAVHHGGERDPRGNRGGAIPDDVGCVGWDGSQRVGGNDAVREDDREGKRRSTDTGLFVPKRSTPPEPGDVVSSTVTGNAGIDHGGGMPPLASYYGVADWDAERGGDDEHGEEDDEGDGLDEALALAEELFRRAAENGISDTPQARALARMGRPVQSRYSPLIRLDGVVTGCISHVFYLRIK